MRKNLLLLLLFLFQLSTTHAQTLTATRSATLVPGDYDITGEATLQEFDNGELRIVLSEDFSTTMGPDVQVLLGDSLNNQNVVMVANISELNHFSGTASFTVPVGTGIDDYKYVIFFCYEFGFLWASGEWGETTVITPEPECFSSSVSGNGTDTLQLCTTDGTNDIVQFSNSTSMPAGDNYAYLITDAAESLTEVVTSDSYNFEGSGEETQRVYGISYQGQLNPMIGANRMMTTASDCFIHSDSAAFLTIIKEACVSPTECQETAVATTDWKTVMPVCPGDGVADLVELRNSLSIMPGAHYIYLITDVNEVLQAVSYDSIYDFESSSMEEQRVYGLSYYGQLSAPIGSHRLDATATECAVHSSATTFLTIDKNGVCTTTGTEENWEEAIEIFPNPAKAKLNIQLPNNTDIQQVTIVNLLGKIVYSETVSNSEVQLDVQNWTSGNYIVRLEGEGQIVNKLVQVTK